jgi:manganese/zinc/iron transport system substrate-binding protein
MVFYVGLMLEGRMSESLEGMERLKPSIAVGMGIDPTKLIRPNGMDAHPDPHVWMDVALWMECLRVVQNALCEFDRAHAAEYQARADAYAERLEALHRYATDSLKTIPEKSRVLITSHDAFHYFGRAYGLEVYGVQGISTESEAGLLQVNALVDLIVDRSVKAVFVESSVPRKSIEAVMEGVRARGKEIVIGGELYSDAMGPSGTYEGTYEGMLDHNITRVTRALGGQAPPRGKNERLAQP